MLVIYSSYCFFFIEGGREFFFLFLFSDKNIVSSQSESALYIGYFIEKR